MEKDIYVNFLLGLSEVERKYAPEQLFGEGDPNLLTTGLKVSIVGVA